MKNNKNKENRKSLDIIHFTFIFFLVLFIFPKDVFAKPLTKDEINEQAKIATEYWSEDEKAINRVISNIYGRNGLHYASVQNDILQLKRLFLSDRSKEINQRDRAGYTPIALAAQHKKIGSATILMEHGANPFIKNNEGKSAVDLAKENGDTEMISILVDGHRPTE